MRRVVWTNSARTDLENIRTYIGQFNPTAAQRMAERLIMAANSLSEFPDRGRLIANGRRESTIIWPYLLRYRVAGDLVYILRIRHGAQKPLP